MRKYVIVGNGVAGVTAAQTLVHADPSSEVHIIGEEPYLYYRRPRLVKLVAGEIEQDAIYYRPPEWYAEHGIHLHLGVRVMSLNPKDNLIILADGSNVHYDSLLLATGGRPFMPPIEGADKVGVFTLRTLDNALAIKTYARDIHSAVVIGGGLLGLEMARALQAICKEVTVVEFAPYLMPRQLDQEGSQVLKTILETHGLHILTSATVKAILGHDHAMGIQLKGGNIVDSELVIISTGIRCRVELAQDARLKVGRGVIVDEHMHTSATNIYAAGDVVEFDGQTYGTIPAAIEQAQIAAANMVTPGNSTYSGTLPVINIKVTGIDITSMGKSVVEAEKYTHLRHTDIAAGQYRKYVLNKGRMVGAILLNDKERVQPVAKLIKQNVDISAHADHLMDDDFNLESLSI